MNADEARAVQTLIEYHISGATVSELAACQAWDVVADAAYDQLGHGRLGRDVAGSLSPRTIGPIAPHPDDPEQCDACHDGDEHCPFHRGAQHGAQMMITQTANAVQAFARDPEQVDAVIAQDEYNQQVEQQRAAQRQQRRIEVDAACPDCASERR